MKCSTKEKTKKIITNTKKIIANTTVDILPIRYYDREGQCYILKDGSRITLLKIVSKDLINSGEDIVELDCLKQAKFFKMYLQDLKIITLNFPTNTYMQQAYFLKKYEKTSNEKQRKWLQKNIRELQYLDKHTTKREFYLMVFSANAEEQLENVNKIKTLLSIGRDGLIEELPVKKQHQIMYKLNNKNSVITMNH